MVAKARTNELNMMLKKKAYKHMPRLVPLTQSITADAKIYARSKEVLPGYEERARKWPRACDLLFGTDEHGDPAFLYTKEIDGADGEPLDEPHGFTAWVVDVAKECNIEVSSLLHVSLRRCCTCRCCTCAALALLAALRLRDPTNLTTLGI